MINQQVVTIFAGALLVNLLLFIVMERMAAQQPVMLTNSHETLSVDFVRLKRTPPPPPIKQQVKPPEKQELLSTPQMQVPSPKPMQITDRSLTMPQIDIPMNISGVPFKGTMGAGGIGSLQEAIPLVRIAPLYPPSALSRRIEGRVKIIFTVTEEGKVLNPVVIASKPRGVFDRAALRAIRKWKFNKRLEDGKPVQWQTVQTIIFQMDKS